MPTSRLWSPNRPRILPHNMRRPMLPHNTQPPTLNQAVELFKREFLKRYPGSRILIDGEGYDDEDLDLKIYADGDQIELEQYGVEVSHQVQAATGYFILAFVDVPATSTAHPVK